MKNVYFLLGLLGLLVFSACNKPSAVDILKKSYDKCQSIENGYYEMSHYMKFISNKDTSISRFECSFKKLPDDTIYSVAFHYNQYYNNQEFARDVLYTGNDFVNFSMKDSTGTIMSKKLWAKEIKSYSHNYTFYSPLTNKKSYPLPADSFYTDGKHFFEFIGEEIINDIPCYHVKIYIIPKNDSTEMMKTIRAETNFWISKKEHIPIQYSIAYDLVMNSDTMYQFEKNVLTKYDLNNDNYESQLKLSSVPSYINLIDYKPYKRPELLPADTMAPGWSLTSLNDMSVSLSDFTGKLVLLDFFYKSCYPCMLALPALQNLHEKYYDKGLRIIGIDPYDTKEKDDIENFLSKRGVTYTVLLGAKDVAKEYHISGYPTIYLIDKEGKIIYTGVGYGEGTERKLEEIIKQNL